MRVFIDVSAAIQHRGMGRYTRELVRTLLQERVKIYGVFRPGRVLKGDFVQRFHTVRRMGAIPVPRELLSLFSWLGGSVFHAVEPVAFIPGFSSTVVTFHDFAQDDERWGEDRNPGFIRAIQNLRKHPPGRVIAVSHHTAKEVAERFPEWEDRIRVVYHGIRRDHFYPESEEVVRSVLKQWDMEWKGYFLYVGEADGRKNLKVLKSVVKDRALPPLVVVGASTRKLQRYLPLDKIRHLGRVSLGELRALYSGAIALLFPSVYEGFGFPVLEAMASGIPVVTTRCSAIPEVGGDVPFYLPPDDPEAWWTLAWELARGEVDPSDRVARGLARAAAFTWETTAWNTLAVYREVLEGA